MKKLTEGWLDWLKRKKKESPAISKVSRLNYSRIVSPDTLFLRHYSPITFIYDPFKKILYSKPYPMNHGRLNATIPEVVKESKKFRLADPHEIPNEIPLRIGFLLGRLAITPPEQDSFKVIAFWNVNFQGNQLSECLNSIIQQYPEYGSPDVMVMSDKDAFYDKKKRNFTVAMLDEIPGVKTVKTTRQAIQYEENPKCNVALDVEGKPTSLDVILGNFHMVKDNRLPAMKAAVCSQGFHMRGKLEKAGCDLQVSMMDELIQKANCKTPDREKYEDLKRRGKIQRREEIESILRNPELTSRYSKRELNQMMDELSEHSMHGFALWLQQFSG